MAYKGSGIREIVIKFAADHILSIILSLFWFFILVAVLERIEGILVEDLFQARLRELYFGLNFGFRCK